MFLFTYFILYCYFFVSRYFLFTLHCKFRLTNENRCYFCHFISYFVRSRKIRTSNLFSRSVIVNVQLDFAFLLIVIQNDASMRNNRNKIWQRKASHLYRVPVEILPSDFIFDRAVGATKQDLHVVVSSF